MSDPTTEVDGINLICEELTSLNRVRICDSKYCNSYWQCDLGLYSDLLYNCHTMEYVNTEECS